MTISPIEPRPDNPDRAVRILLYSDNIDTRASVRMALGSGRGVAPGGVDWTEAATPATLMEYAVGTRFDLIVLDGEAAKVGGMSLCRELKNEVFECPPVLMLVARPQDAWLASWADAEAIAVLPVDPIAVEETISDLLTVDA